MASTNCLYISRFDQWLFDIIQWALALKESFIVIVLRKKPSSFKDNLKKEQNDLM